jgi:hypothetical protein
MSLALTHTLGPFMRWMHVIGRRDRRIASLRGVGQIRDDAGTGY